MKLRLIDKYKAFVFLALTTILSSCGKGYEKVEGRWAWVLRSEAGKHIREMDVDNESFEILDDENYAKDNESVYFEGVKIDFANPKTFEVLTEGYSKDHKYVFLDNHIVVFANPLKFEIIEWPFAKDDRFIFNGTVPITSKNIDEFVVTKATGDKHSFLKSFFIEMNEDFEWLDTLNGDGVIIDEDAEGETSHEKFKGIRKVGK